MMDDIRIRMNKKENKNKLEGEIFFKGYEVACN